MSHAVDVDMDSFVDISVLNCVGLLLELFGKVFLILQLGQILCEFCKHAFDIVRSVFITGAGIIEAIRNPRVAAN